MEIIENILENGDKTALHTLILAHGAGAGKEHPFMEAFAGKLANRGFRVIRFDFPYMIKARDTGKRRPPDRQTVLIEAWQTMIEWAGAEKVIIGGKSLGGRIASLVADTAPIRGLVCLGYPFHAPGKPESPRTEHLATLATPTLICQGTRDPFGKQEEVETYKLSSSIQFQWLEDGEHSFKPRKASGLTEEQNFDAAIDAIEQFAITLS